MMGKQLCLTFLPFALVTPMLSLATFAQEKPLRPNVVYIVSDDQGWKDVGYHGSDIKTPMHKVKNDSVRNAARRESEIVAELPVANEAP